MTRLLIISLTAYFIGSIPFSILITRIITGQDVRTRGSGHAGATNTMRIAGWGAGVLVLILDIGKGALAIWLADVFGRGFIEPAIFRSAAASLVVVGHCWPVLASFRGGMGMATAGGALLYTWPFGFVLGVGLAAAAQLAVRHSARGNILTGVLVGPLWMLFGGGWPRVGVALAVGVVVAIRAVSDWGREYRELWFDR
ncbi:MAG: glycerol-3-phosphate acyltransferase [Anaerolineales bacterium]|nr:glycerol-3-phosphate acyltransferase [Anaerolineales bacterium]